MRFSTYLNIKKTASLASSEPSRLELDKLAVQGMDQSQFVCVNLFVANKFANYINKLI